MIRCSSPTCATALDLPGSDTAPRVLLEAALRRIGWRYEQQDGDETPRLYCPIHPDMLERDYHSSREEVLDYMGRWDYEHTFLGVDHEEHHLFSWNPF